jgi:glutathione S-transferase
MTMVLFFSRGIDFLTNFFNNNSATIARYLNDRFKEICSPNWYPSDMRKRAKINMYLDWHHQNTRAHLFRHIYENFTAVKQLRRPYNPEIAAQTLSHMKRTLQQINDHWLGQTPFVSGLQEPSLADLFLYGEIAQLLYLTEPDQSVRDSSFMKDLENIKQWMLEMEKLPHYDQVHKLLPTVKERFKEVPLV